MSRGFWLIPFALLLALIASYLLWHDRVQQSQIPIGPIPSAMTPQITLDPRHSSKVTAALERCLPENFKSDDGMQRTVHRMGDTLNVEIFLIYSTFDESGVRPDAPVTMNLSGKKLGAALLAIFGSDDPPLRCSVSGDMILITAPSFNTPDVLARTYVVDDIAPDSASEQRLLTDLQTRIGPQIHLGHFSRGNTSLRCQSGKLLVAQPAMFHYLLTKYLNDLHRKQAILSVSLHTAATCAGSIALALLWVHLRFRLVQRRWLRSGLCTACGYDLRASVDRCPECGTPFTPASPNPAATPPPQA